jgi:hypothetical protein
MRKMSVTAADLAHSAYTRITRQLPDTGSLVRDHQRAGADASGGGGGLAACGGREATDLSAKAAIIEITIILFAVVLAEGRGRW